MRGFVNKVFEMEDDFSRQSGEGPKHLRGKTVSGLVERELGLCLGE